MSHKFVRFIPLIIWMCVIFFFSSQQTTGVPGTFNQRFVILKSMHLAEYAILASLAYYAIRHYKKTMLIAYLYACTDEVHQYFVPGRTSKLTDTLIDLLGISLGLLIIKYVLIPVTSQRKLN